MKKKALALISGGLDSLLATKIILEQGINVEGINFFTGFSGDTPPELQSLIPSCLHSHSANKIAQQLGVRLHVIDVVDVFKSVLLHPKYGYGANFNPCLDCKLFMINCARQWMEKLGFDFLISGEVLGQRPMSQRKDTLPLGAKDSGDLLLRPLSAKLLSETLVERNGWVERDKLCAISGRGRKEQIALATRFSLKDYQQPAGGCKLTEHAYCARFHDLYSKNGQKEGDSYTLDDIMLACLGRHLRVTPNLKLIVGRNHEDNQGLAMYQKKYPTMTTVDFPGALVMLFGDLSNTENIKMAAKITARFSQGKDCELVKVKLRHPANSSNVDGNIKILEVAPIKLNEISEQWYVPYRKE